MSLLLKGISRLSELEIDVNKNWAGHLIKNIGPAVDSADALRKADAILQAVMSTKGDIIFRGDTGAERLAPDAGKGYSFLRSRGPGLSPVWQDIEGLIQYMTDALNRAVAFDLALLMPAISQVSQQASSPPGRTASPMLLSVPEPSVGIETATGDGGGVTATPWLNIPTASISQEVATGEPVGGAVADDGGVQTDETSAANNDTTNDMTLLPPVPAVDDAYHFGHASPWDWLELRIGTAGNGIWTIVWEYWNGSSWNSLSDVIDGTNGFRATGTKLVTFTKPLDWSQADGLYWIRARVSAYTSITTQPKGNRAFTWIKR